MKNNNSLSISCIFISTWIDVHFLKFMNIIYKPVTKLSNEKIT